MKRLVSSYYTSTLAMLVVALIACATLLAAAEPRPGASHLAQANPWTGIWTTYAGNITFTQTGARVAGAYPGGFIEGIAVQYATGNQLTGTWRQGKAWGKVYFTLSADGTSFSGYYTNLDSTKKHGDWSGTRIGAKGGRWVFRTSSQTRNEISQGCSIAPGDDVVKMTANNVRDITPQGWSTSYLGLTYSWVHPSFLWKSSNAHQFQPRVRDITFRWDDHNYPPSSHAVGLWITCNYCNKYHGKIDFILDGNTTSTANREAVGELQCPTPIKNKNLVITVHTYLNNTMYDVSYTYEWVPE